jgi:Flp pilus assembly pilin Flp
VEYALLLALIAVLCVIAVTVLGGNLQSSIDTNASKVADA